MQMQQMKLEGEGTEQDLESHTETGALHTLRGHVFWHKNFLCDKPPPCATAVDVLLKGSSGFWAERSQRAQGICRHAVKITISPRIAVYKTDVWRGQLCVGKST